MQFLNKWPYTKFIYYKGHSGNRQKPRVEKSKGFTSLGLVYAKILGNTASLDNMFPFRV